MADIDQMGDVDNLEECIAELKRVVDYNLNAKKLAKAIAEVGVEVFCFHATSHSGNVWYTSKVAPKFSFLDERDLISELKEECNRYDIDITCLMQVVCNQRMHDEHPEWRQINSEGNCCNVSPRVCFNNPEYRTYFLTQVEEVAAYGVKAILIDELDFNGRLGGGLMCFCDSCRKLFRAQHGGDMPTVEDWNDPQWIKFIRFRFNSLTSFIKEVRTCIKRVDPKVLLSIISYSMLKTPWTRLQPIESFSEYLDFFCQDTGGFDALLHAKFFVAYSNHKAEIMGAASTLSSYFTGEAETELATECMSICDIMNALSHNMSWNMDISYKPLPADQVISQEILDYYHVGIKEINKRMEWIQGHQESVSQIGLFYSENSNVFYGQNNPKLYYNEFIGYFDILTNSGHIFDVVGARHLTMPSLKKYKVIILPAASCLSVREVEVFRDYVAQGGCIIASYNTSLYDSDGKKRSDFALHDVFGCSYDFAIPEKDYVYGQQASDAFRRKTIEYAFMKHESFAPSVSAYALTTPTIVPKNHKGTVTGLLFRSKKALRTFIPGYTHSVTYDSNPLPFITNHKFGKGNAVYIGAKLGALFVDTEQCFAKKTILTEIDHLVKEKLDFIVNAPSCIQATAFRQNDKTIIIHLSNFQLAPRRFDINNWSQMRIRSIQTEDILPVYNVEIELRNVRGSQILRTYTAPDKKIVKLESGNGVLLAKIPEIKFHSMLVVECNVKV